MLTIDIIEKKYSNHLILKNVKINIDKTGIYGLVGKNGQGKTTLFRCILGIEKFKGDCFINDDKISLQNAAWCPTEPSIYGELTAIEFYDFYSHLLDLGKRQNFRLFNVNENQLIRDFSTGMKKKTFLNAIFQKTYPVYIFDEPFNGLDLESNYLLINYIKEIAKDSIVFISSHILDILYKDCDSIFLLSNTKIKEFKRNEFSEIEEELFQN